ncbi:MAG: glutamate--tRNA ligase [Patescibacteria group bacterium]|nr:glutamate--tRNA ligase [Patescibacteria group bacterium]
MPKIKTRFAPSPTGYLHIGSLRTALFSYLFAKNQKGKFIIRIEDTDRQRFVAGAEEKLIKVLTDLGLSSDEKIIRQSERLKIYQQAAERLIKEKKAYYCFCSQERLEEVRKNQEQNKQVPRYDRHCLNFSDQEIQQRLSAGKKHVIRFKVPDNQIVAISDQVYGKISVKTQDLDDFVIIKSDDFPTYHLANIVDDHETNISHVIRGDEWLPSLPKHILLYQALKYQAPVFAHLPLLLNPDRSKLSKRQGDVAVEDFLAKGYLPEALINYVALLGWNPGTDQEIFTVKDLIKEFSLAKVNKAGAIFDINKLNWFNAEYIRLIVKQKGERYRQLLEQLQRLIPNHASSAEKLLLLFCSRINNLQELIEQSRFLFALPEYKGELLIFKKSDQDKTKLGLNLLLGTLGQIHPDHWQDAKLKLVLENLVAKNKLSAGDVFWPARVALSGLDKSPSPTEIMEFLGKEESLSRVKKALKKFD